VKVRSPQVLLFVLAVLPGSALVLAQTTGGPIAVNTNNPPDPGEQNIPYNLGSGFAFSATPICAGNCFWSEVLPGLGSAAGPSQLPPGLTLNANGTGVLSGTPTTTGNFTFTIRVSCSTCTPTTAQATFSMQIFAPLQITSASVPNPRANSFFQFQFTAQGGDPTAYNWDNSSGSPQPFATLANSGRRTQAARLQPLATACLTGFGIPPGLCLDPASGILSGFPNTPGRYFISLTLFDNRIFNSVSKSFSIIVDPAPLQTGLSLSGGGNLGTILLGGSISAGFTASGGAPPYTFTTTVLPDGITFAGSALSGSPKAPGNYGIFIQVTDTQHSTATASAGFSVFGIVPGGLPDAVTSSPYSVAIPVAGGQPPYHFAATGAPPGFTISTSGVVSGTAATPGTYTLSATVTDANGLSYTAPVPFTVALPMPLKVPGGPLPDTTRAIPYTQPLTASGGAPPYTWSLAGGVAPDGLTLRPNGTLAGTPFKSGTFTFAVRVTDVVGAFALGSFTLAVAPQPVLLITPSPLASGMVTVDYPFQVLSATGGVTPFTFTVTDGALPAGLALSANGYISGIPTTAGTSTFTVTATDAGGLKGSASLQIVVRPFSPDLIISAGSLAFALSAGSAGLPGAQTLQVQSTDVTKILGYKTAITPAVPWLTVSAGGNTPGYVTVSLTNDALALSASATPYKTTIVATCLAPAPCAGNTQTVAVSLTVTATPPQLTILNDLLSFTTSSLSPQPTTQILGVQNTGGGSIGIQSIGCPPAWCKVGTYTSALFGGVPNSISITADPTGFKAGYYYTDLTIVTSIGTAIVPVTYFIAANSTINLAPAGVQLTMPAGGIAAVPENSFLVSVAGDAPISWTATVLPGAPWLKLGTTSGTSTGSAPGSITFSLDQASAAALVAQAYYGTIRVSSPAAVNSPQDFQVVLNVTPAVDRQKPSPFPGGLLFLTTASGTPPPQIVQVFASSIPPVAYQASASTIDGNAWLSVSPTIGNASVAAPGQAAVTVKPAGLAPGTYHGTASYQFSASAVRSVNVTLVVQAPPAVPNPANGARLSSSDAAPAGCAVTQLVPTQTGLVTNFAAPASWPTPLEILLVDNCGNPVTNGQVIATFSNADPPLALTLTDTTSGLYSGTWTPRHPGSQVSISARATASGFPTATVQIAGAVIPNVAPVLNHNGTLHVFNPQVGAPLAPGTIVQIFGSGLASQTQVNTTIPLANTLAGTSVIIGGIQAPLFFVSPGQVNAQIPFELTPGQPYQIIVNANGALTTPDSLQSAIVAPGVAALPTGWANAQHSSDGSLITDASPARPGEFIVMYLAGMGLTDTPVASGAGAPSNPLARTQSPPSVTLDSVPVPFLFAGLTPGLAGLYQINIQIPAAARDGDLTLVVNQGDFQGGSVILPVHK
jgi:uncharacterized protein (TIGR03437 family)